MTGVKLNKINYIGINHMKTCGGKYIKIAEPEGFKKD
jgi:hypothetical protein